jgi:signal peptidase II
MRGPAALAWTRALMVAGTVVLLDQASKAAITASLAPGEHVSLVLGFDLVRVTNRGIAFGLFGGGGGVVLVVTAIALLLVLGWFARDPTHPGLWLAVGLLAGGALGNLADRVREDAVTDFLDPPLWPAFNLADVAITAGAIALVLIALAPTDSS